MYSIILASFIRSSDVFGALTSSISEIFSFKRIQIDKLQADKLQAFQK